jgi:hypothetical protein
LLILLYYLGDAFGQKMALKIEAFRNPAGGGLGDRLHDVTISGDLRRTRLAVLA